MANPLYEGSRKARPTQHHRPALWENMLGTVYARSAAGEIRYFDYDWDAARAFAGVNVEGADLRTHRLTPSMPRYQGWPGYGTVVLWVRDPA